MLARELVAGECLEILHTGGRPDPRASLKVIRYKTAKYTVEHPLHIGGALAGAPRDLRAAFSAYGLPLGEAFQLRDDLLGLFGDPGRTGKANADDITRHTGPPPCSRTTWQHAPPDRRAEAAARCSGARELGRGRAGRRVREIMQRCRRPGPCRGHDHRAGRGCAAASCDDTDLPRDAAAR